MLDNGTLCVERLRRPSDEGIYECLATHPLGSIASPKVRLMLESEFLCHLLFGWSAIDLMNLNLNLNIIEFDELLFSCGT